MQRLREKENIIQIPIDLYKEIALYADLDTLYALAITDTNFNRLYEDPYFWKDKILQEFPFAMDPNREEPYTVNSYESIIASYAEAEEMIQQDKSIILRYDWPWHIQLDHREYDSISNIKFFNQGCYYTVFFKYLKYDDDPLMIVEKHMTKSELLKLLTNLIYNQDIRIVKNI